MVARSASPNPVPTLALPDENATLALGAALAPHLVPGMLVTLRGELGAGKTTLVRGLLRALGHAGRVKSPTYAPDDQAAIQSGMGTRYKVKTNPSTSNMSNARPPAMPP